MPRTPGWVLVIASGAIEILIALALWWRPEHAMVWAILAGCVLAFAAMFERR